MDTVAIPTVMMSSFADLRASSRVEVRLLLYLSDVDEEMV